MALFWGNPHFRKKCDFPVKNWHLPDTGVPKTYGPRFKFYPQSPLSELHRVFDFGEKPSSANGFTRLKMKPSSRWFLKRLYQTYRQVLTDCHTLVVLSKWRERSKQDKRVILQQPIGQSMPTRSVQWLVSWKLECFLWCYTSLPISSCIRFLEKNTAI